MKKVKEIVKSLGKHTAYNSVGKSLPAALYEPKVPQSLKVKATEQK
ncbi:MAG: exodeoxyribonuclease V subunit alpha [Lachnospiraceae bacterium]|nr:exodeoxyribonuclease V subunit alpha [Lachnospiraceae bacterium]